LAQDETVPRRIDQTQAKRHVTTAVEIGRNQKTMILRLYTIIHTLISLAGIFTGFVVLFGLLGGKRLDGWTKSFLVTTMATSVTGFGFPLITLAPRMWSASSRWSYWHLRSTRATC